MKIHYEPHPVTPERKAELRAHGFKIIDARFKPLDVVDAIGADALQTQAETPPAPVAVKRGRPRKAAE